MCAVSISADIGVCSRSNQKNSVRPDTAIASCDQVQRAWAWAKERDDQTGEHAPAGTAGWPAGRLDGWPAGRLAGWPAGWVKKTVAGAASGAGGHTVMRRSLTMMVRPSMSFPAVMSCLNL